MFDVKDGQLKISVRNFVEFFCRSGNIDNRFSGVTDKSAMEAGSRAHRKIQKSMGPDYRSEVVLSYSRRCSNYELVLWGRADGIFFDEDGRVTIDEIKGTYKDIRYITEPVYVHKAQALCYAYFYATEMNLDSIGIRMTYVNLDNEAVKYFSEVFEYPALESWFNDACAQLIEWADFLHIHRQERNESIAQLKFPFEYRPGQRALSVSVYNAIKNKERLFIQAPTGVGKTISTVFPAVMAMGGGLSEKIFYLTAKTITRTAAENAFDALSKAGLVCRTLTITAKEKVCPMEEAECNPIACERARGHYDRVNEAVFDLVRSVSHIDRRAIEEYAAKYNVCPYEMCLDVSYFCDAVICDYNYVFDPHVYLRRYFGESNDAEYIFLIDEAHNLVDRAREMFSASVVKEKILEMKRLVKDYSPKLARAMEKCNSAMLALKRRCEAQYMEIEPSDVPDYDMQRLSEELLKFMEDNRDFPHMKELSLFYFDVMHFNYIAELMDENYISYCEHTDEGFMLRLFCVNPSANLGSVLDFSAGSAFFSATLLPVNYYKELLSGDTNDKAVYASSHFDTSKRYLAIGRDVTSRYTRRNLNEYQKIRDYVLSVTTAKPGNYMVFFPAYAYMAGVYRLVKDCESGRLIVPSQDMTEADKEDFLSEFSENREGTLIGLCVMGGVFSEGIDLQKDSLIGAIIVGTGLPSINTASELLRTYYDRLENSGYEYAYVYPGMNKVLQAAGRVIRTDEDRGVVLLLDDRFLGSTYRRLFPKEWEDCRVVSLDRVGQEVLDFWNKE